MYKVCCVTFIRESFTHGAVKPKNVGGNTNLEEKDNNIKSSRVRTFISDGPGTAELVLHVVFHDRPVSCSQVYVL